MWQRMLTLALVPALHTRNELDAFPARLHNDKSLGYASNPVPRYAKRDSKLQLHTEMALSCIVY